MIVTALAALVIGYVIGRSQPARRISDWATWQANMRQPAGIRLAAVWTVMSAGNLTWIAAHPIRAQRAWKHRNDPAPTYSPAVRIRRTTNTATSTKGES